ncbi:putative aspartyl/glutamyl-tRNA(Asn/Gln) amidotransferase, C subunit [Dictyocaulus viviparus]|uniref:Putative aspartyl/glutamyl-tRNA(Asn/Gln) amidotransferase, C subunit n=1 Tax=Dictyocaulus viviparus TaxID=29172 RepID=A0A0D8XWG5_DICVI|nr:putative aspartyl/glutamyl-tRNA(Asn/Gln) amidotransferase, C subunit [Dictyocaulus viviparus]
MGGTYLRVSQIVQFMMLVYIFEFVHKITNSNCAADIEFDQKLISILESLSLIRFQSEQDVADVKMAVKKAKMLQNVDSENAEKMFTVWAEQECPMHDDVPEKPLTVKEVLSNATRFEDDYFVSPPGNVPLKETATLDLNLVNQWDKFGRPVAPMPKKQKIDVS